MFTAVPDVFWWPEEHFCSVDLWDYSTARDRKLHNPQGHLFFLCKAEDAV